MNNFGFYVRKLIYYATNVAPYILWIHKIADTYLEVINVKFSYDNEIII